jgi:hypothetical protein
MTTREQIIAAAKDAGLFAYGDPLERFYSIAHEDGRASRDEEIAELRKQLAELLDWQQKAFAAHPNIDIDIDRLKGGN